MFISKRWELDLMEGSHRDRVLCFHFFKFSCGLMAGVRAAMCSVCPEGPGFPNSYFGLAPCRSNMEIAANQGRLVGSPYTMRTTVALVDILGVRNGESFFGKP